MSDSHSLNTLITRAQQRTDDALQNLGNAQRQLTQAQLQLDALRSYRHDYQVQLQTSMQGGLDTGTFRNYALFLDSLDSAVAQQSNLIEQIGQQLAQRKGEWSSEKRSLDSYETLAKKRIHQAQAAALRREQKTLDEYAQRLHARTSARGRHAAQSSSQQGGLS